VCGICGVVLLRGEPRLPLDSGALDRMTDAMTHRGPDERGTYLAPGIALGARRLAIVDVGDGHQPALNEDGSVRAIQNGELYNHLALRSEYDRHAYASRCDTEILPHLYEEVGPRFPERLRGKFAIAIWDEPRRRLVLARDRLGVKPLYYSRQGDVLVFASELKSLLASGLVPAELDYEAIDAYLTLGFTPAPRTPLAGVSKLQPGSRLVVSGGEALLERYWDYPLPRPDEPARSEAEYAEELIEHLEDAVRARLMSDVPLGAMLSGGLDSSLVVALMARNTTEPVKTFSVGFGDGGVASELADARYVAQVLGTEHHELELSLADAATDLEELVWTMDEPVADLSSLGLFALSKLAAQHVTVGLCGQGADELLGGYERYRTAAVADRWQRLPGPLRAVGEHAAAHGNERWQRLGRTLAAPDASARFLNMTRLLAPDLRDRLYVGPLREAAGGAERAVASALAGVEASALETTLYADAQLALVDDLLHYFDRASMAHSLELRVPFLDHHVVEFCAKVPSDLKVRGLRRKHLLKRAARGLVPDRIVEKRKVGFFHHGIDAWFDAQAEQAIPRYLLGELHSEGLLDRETVRALIDAHRSRGGRLGRLLLAILLLEVWLATFVPRATGPLRAARPVAVQA
jgi:asparagine synthase (glutamine-hydrolysing)